MLFDTDILIWVQRGNTKAADIIERTQNRKISIQTYMELLQGAQNKQQQQRYTKSFLKEFNFFVLPLTENIGHRALIYVEEFSMSDNMRAADAIIAATAIENNIELCSSNVKHFSVIKELQLIQFKP